MLATEPFQLEWREPREFCTETEEGRDGSLKQDTVLQLLLLALREHKALMQTPADRHTMKTHSKQQL